MRRFTIQPLLVIMLSAFFITACDREMKQDYNRDYDDVNVEDSIENGQLEGITPALQQFIDEAASDGKMEVLLADIIIQRGNNLQVKDLAQTIKKDHQEANLRLMEIARTNNISLPEAILPKHQQKVEQIQSLSSPQLSREYVKMMVEGHQDVIRKFKNAAGIADATVPSEAEELPVPASMYSEDGDNINNAERLIKEWINYTLPVLQKHLDQAQQLNR